MVGILWLQYFIPGYPHQTGSTRRGEMRGAFAHVSLAWGNPARC